MQVEQLLARYSIPSLLICTVTLLQLNVAGFSVRIFATMKKISRLSSFPVSSVASAKLGDSVRSLSVSKLLQIAVDKSATSSTTRANNRFVGKHTKQMFHSNDSLYYYGSLFTLYCYYYYSHRSLMATLPLERLGQNLPTEYNLSQSLLIY